VAGTEVPTTSQKPQKVELFEKKYVRLVINFSVPNISLLFKLNILTMETLKIVFV